MNKSTKSTTTTHQLPVQLKARPATLIECARHLTETAPERPALTIIMPDGNQTTFSTREFFDYAARYARAMQKAGVEAGDLVVLVLQHSPDVLFSFWGALLLGAVPSIMPFLTPKLDPERYYASVRALVELSEVKAVLTYDEMLPSLRDHLQGVSTLGAILNVEDLKPEGSLDDYLDGAPVDPAATAFLQHSSGSTGLQKGVMLSHAAVLNQIAAYSAAIDLNPDDVIVSWLPLYHDMGLIAGFIMPVIQGIHLVLMSPFHWVREPKILLDAIQEHGGTLCWLPNFAYNFLATRIRPSALEGTDLSSIRAFVNCSEPVRAESHQIFAEKFSAYKLPPASLSVCYAMAENTFAVTQTPVGTDAKQDLVDRDALMTQRRAVPPQPVANGTQPPTVTMVSCGRPIPNTELRIVDGDRQSLPDRHVGEIALRSDCMLTGYYHRDDATTAALDDGWYFTGDLGYIAGGELYITGRQKDLIIVGGKNIYPQDIENLINDVDGVHPGRTVAFGVPNNQLGTEDIAVIAEVETDDPDAHKTIMTDIRGRIAQATDVMARFVHLVEPMWLLKTSSGKIARAANREKFLKDVLKRSV